MSEAPRRINTERSLNRPTEKRPAEAPASKTSLNGQPDFFQPEEPAAPQELPKAKARPEPDTRQELGLKMPAASSGGTGGNAAKRKRRRRSGCRWQSRWRWWHCCPAWWSTRPAW